MKTLFTGFGLLAAGVSLAQSIPHFPAHCEHTRAGCPDPILTAPTSVPVDGAIKQFLFDVLPQTKTTSLPFAFNEIHGIAAVDDENDAYTILSCTEKTGRAMFLSCKLSQSGSAGNYQVVSDASAVIGLLKTKPGVETSLADQKIATFLFKKLPFVKKEGPSFAVATTHGIAAPIPAPTEAGAPNSYTILSCKESIMRAVNVNCTVSVANDAGDYPVVESPTDVVELFKAAQIPQNQ